MRSKEHLSIIRPKENYLVLQQLRFDEELRPATDLKIPSGIRISAEEMTMASSLIKQYTKKFDISKYQDEYKKELMKIIKSKASGKKISTKKMEVVYTRKDDLFDQLKASLGTKSTAKKRAS